MNGVKVTVDPIMLIGSETGFTAAEMESWALQEGLKTKDNNYVSDLKVMRPTKAETPTRAETPKKSKLLIWCLSIYSRLAVVF